MAPSSVAVAAEPSVAAQPGPAVATVSPLLMHELRATAGVIQGFVDTLRGADGWLEETERQRCLDCLCDASARLTWLLDQLADQNGSASEKRLKKP
jgi:hypothetical protein